MSIVQELKRRNVFRVAIAYVVAAWIVIEASSLILQIYDLPTSVIRVIVALLALGLPFAIAFAWAFEVTPEGIKRESEVARTSSISTLTAKRLDIVTIALVLFAIFLFSADRWLLDINQGVVTPVSSTDGAQKVDHPMGTDHDVDSYDDPIWQAQQLLEIDRLRAVGKYKVAFELAAQLDPYLDDEYTTDEFWAGFTYSTDIDSNPQGAKVLRQPISTDDEHWEELGITPLKSVRFPIDEGYRIRLEMDGYRTVELLHEALLSADYWGGSSTNPVKLDPDASLPEEMVRLPGFTRDLVDYGDYFMDRFEVTNRDFQAFVSGGGYRTSDLWTQPFIRDGQEVRWEDAIASFVDQTGRPGPSTWSGGVYPSGKADFPVSGVSWYEANAYANYVDKQLPTTSHHEGARRFFIDSSWLVLPRSNFDGNGPWAAGHGGAMTSMGIFDLTGNVREWLWNEVNSENRGTAGGAWSDAPYIAIDIISKSPWDRDPTNGFRLIRSFDGQKKTERLRERYRSSERRDFRTEQPASDREYEIYRSMYLYDPLPLNSEIVSVDSAEHWTRERAEFDLPSGERGAALLYIPNSGSPPFETVVYWPGSGELEKQSVSNRGSHWFDFLVRNGRVVVQPIFWGTLDRDDSQFSINEASVWPTDSSELGVRHRDLKVTWIQELSRTIDYLETRDDISTENLGFYGFSWGGEIAPIALAIEGPRFAAAALNVGGLNAAYQDRAEADPLNFLPQVKLPVLMINGEFDVDYPYELSQKPMFDLLGTDPANKEIIVEPAAHYVRREVLIREMLAWFDRYLSGQDSLGSGSRD